MQCEGHKCGPQNFKLFHVTNILIVWVIVRFNWYGVWFVSVVFRFLFLFFLKHFMTLCVNIFKEQYIFDGKIEKSHWFKKTTEAVVQRCSVKKVLLEISKKSQENACARVSFLIKLRPANLWKKRLWHRCFAVNFLKFLRTPFYIEHLWWLLLKQYKCKCLSCSFLAYKNNMVYQYA